MQHPHQATYHCLASPTQPGQPPVIQETQQPHGAESFVIHQDLNQVCPVFFEQGQATSGGLALCSKNNNGCPICVFPKLWREIKFIKVLFSEGLSCVPLFYEPPFFVGCKISHPARNRMLGCPYILLAHHQSFLVYLLCNDYRVVCHENLLPFTLRRERSKQPPAVRL